MVCSVVGFDRVYARIVEQSVRSGWDFFFACLMHLFTTISEEKGAVALEHCRFWTSVTRNPQANLQVLNAMPTGGRLVFVPCQPA